MIFNKKDLIRKQPQVTFRRYDLIGGDFSIICQSAETEDVRKDCKLYYSEKSEGDRLYKFVLSFLTPLQRWSEDKFLHSFDEALRDGGKQKLIRAIYNDFEA
jgi:hypothetical protein